MGTAVAEMQVPFFRPAIRDEEIAAVVSCLESGWLTTGPNAKAFEQEFSDVLGGDIHSIAVNSATAAMHLALEAMGVRKGDEVIVPTLTFTATAEVVRYLGATPVFVDIDRSSLCLTPEGVAGAISPRTKVIMPVHFAGYGCNMTALRRIADQHGLKILDDAAHALPTRHRDSLIGARSSGADATAFSFYANKTMTTGEGGMLVVSDPEIAERARIMRLHGIDRDVFNRFTETGASWMYDVVAPGFKYNLTDMASALGRVQLKRVHDFCAERTIRAARYDAGLCDLPLVLPSQPEEADTHAWHLYIVQVASEAPVDRNTFIERLNAAGIGTSVHYRPLHQMTYWSQTVGGRQFPQADAYFQRCVSLPLFMGMSDAQQDYVIDTICKILAR